MRTLRGLDSVRVNKDDVLEKLEDNHTQHMADYKEAIKGWELEVHLTAEDIASGHEVQSNLDKILRLRREKPSSHEDDYLCAIEMLKASLDDELELSSSEFKSYMLDDWHWKQEFRMSTSRYTD